MYKQISLTSALEPISKLTKGSKDLFRTVTRDGYRILTKNSKPIFVLVDFKIFEELAMAKEELDKIKREEENRIKFEELATFLKTVPVVEASEEEKKLMSIIDNDKEEQLRIQRIIEEKRRRINAEKINTTN